MANAVHLIGALVLTTTAIAAAAAEVARPVRFLNAAFGLALLVMPLVFETTTAGFFNLLCGLALIGLSLPRGRIRGVYGGWNRWIV